MISAEPPVSRGEVITVRIVAGALVLIIAYIVAYLNGYDICRHPTSGIYIASITESDWYRSWSDETDYIDEKIWIYHDAFTGEEKRLWVIETATRTDNTYDFVYELPARLEDKDSIKYWKEQYALHPLKP